MTLWHWWSVMSAKPSVVPIRDLETRYAAAVEDYMRHGGEACLHRAYELGREAIRQGRSILEVIELHRASLARILPSSAASRESTRAAEAGCTFLAEAMSSYEMINRAFGEANATL